MDNKELNILIRFIESKKKSSSRIMQKNVKDIGSKSGTALYRMAENEFFMFDKILNILEEIKD